MAGTRRQTWITGSRAWLQRNCPEAVLRPDLTPGAVSSLVRKAVQTRSERQAVAKYKQCGYDETKEYLSEALKYPGDSVGVHWITRARLGGIWTAQQYVRIGWLDENYKTRCPFCNAEGNGETLEHLLIRCDRWNDLRQPLMPMIEEVFQLTHQRVPARDVERSTATYLLGGRLRGADGAGYHEDDDFVGRWVRPQPPQHQQTLQDQGAEVPGFILVSRFLAGVMRLRPAILSRHLIPQRADAAR